MTLVVQTNSIPLREIEGYPWPDERYLESSNPNYRIRIRTTYEDEVPATGVVLYAPGSGATDFLNPEDPLMQELLSKGYVVSDIASFGVAGSSESPFRYGYGNVNAPHFTSSWIRNAWEIQAALRALWGENGTVTGPFVMLGQSRGAAAMLAWAAGYCGEDAEPYRTGIISSNNFRGMIVNGPTIAGLGGNKWNDMNRNINSMSNVIALNDSVKTLMTFGNLDDFAPPDYVKRIQQCIPEGAPTYVLTPGGARGHNWMDTTTGAPIMGQWVEQMMTNATITRADGTTPAIPGSVIGG